MKPKLNEYFFNTWLPDLVYILGIITIDGCLVEYKNGYHRFDITSKDIELLERIKAAMQATHKISKKTRSFLNFMAAVFYNSLQIN